MKKLLLAGLLAFGSLAYAAETPNVIGPFLGVNNTDNPATIPAPNAQDALNVDLSLGGRSVKKREGYGLQATLAITTSPVHGVYRFFDGTGNDVALFFNDTRMTSSINGGTPAVIFSNGPSGATYQCTDSQGFAYCVNTTRNNVIKTDGVTSTTIAPASTGTIITVTPDRLVLAGFATAANRVDFSAAGDFTSWTTGISPTSAFNFTITAPGARITHLCYAFNRVFWFKDNSFGYILQGQTAADWVVQTVSPNIGTLDNSSAYDKGILYFRAQDAHIYSYDGSNLVKLTRDIGATISTSQRRASNSFTQSTQGEWANGFDITSIYIDTATVAGDVQMTFPDNFNSLRDGSSGSKNVWTGFCQFSGCTNPVVASGNLSFSHKNLGADETAVVTTNVLNNYKQGTTFYFTISTMSTSNQNIMRFVLSTQKTTGCDPTSGCVSDYFVANFISSNPTKGYLNQLYDGLSTTQVNKTEFVFPLNISVWIATSNAMVTINNVVVGTRTHAFTNGPVYAYLLYSANTVATSTAAIDNFGIAPETATYYSAVKNAAALTTWDSFQVSKVDNGGTHTFYIRTSTNPIQVNSSTPSWTVNVVGSVPTVSTGTYFQIRDDFAITNATQAPSLQEFTQNWFEGNATDKAYATYFKDAIWWSVASGVGATSNNRILRFDLLNNTWLFYDIPINGFYTTGTDLYFGSSLGGYIYKFGNGTTSDNGTAINAYWKSKDFFGESPFTDSDVPTLSLFFSAVANSSMTVTYTLQGSSSTAYTVPLTRANATFGIFNRAMPQGTTGNTFNLKFGNNAADQQFELFSAQYGTVEKPWKPGSQ